MENSICCGELPTHPSNYCQACGCWKELPSQAEKNTGYCNLHYKELVSAHKELPNQPNNKGD